MKEKMIPMGQKEVLRSYLMKMAEAGKITLKEESEKIGVFFRQGGETDSECERRRKAKVSPYQELVRCDLKGRRRRPILNTQALSS
jgi:hypothetical protein